MLEYASFSHYLQWLLQRLVQKVDVDMAPPCLLRTDYPNTPSEFMVNKYTINFQINIYCEFVKFFNFMIFNIFN